MTQRIGNLAVDLTMESAAFRRDLKRAARDMQSASARMNKALTTIDRTANKAGMAVSRFAKSFGALAAGYAVQRLARDFLRVGIYAERMQKGLQAATGSMEAANKTSAFLKQTSEELGLVYISQIEAYRKLAAAARGSALEGQAIKDIYLSIVQASTALQLSQQDVELALYAITQMISKGKVSMEELRRQLGERLPGAFQIAAEAMGMTTMELDKFVSNGKLMADEFLPKFAKALSEEYAGAWQKSSETAQSNINRLKNTWMELQTTVMESGALDAFNESLKVVNRELKAWIENNGELLQALPGIIEAGMQAAGAWGKAIATMAQWPKYALSIPRGLYKSMRFAFETGPEAAARAGAYAAGLPGAAAYTPGTGARPFTPYAPDLSHLAESYGAGTAGLAGTAGAYLGADYLATKPGPRREPMMDLAAMAEQIQKGRRIQQEMVDDLIVRHLDEIETTSEETFSAIDDAATTAGWGMENAFQTFFNASSQGFMDLEALGMSVLQSLQQSAAQLMVDTIFSAITGGMTGWGGAGGGGGAISGLMPFGGYRADGGPVFPGRSYMVGEHGPEMFTPDAAGQIDPIGGGVQIVNNYYIDAIDTESFNRAIEGRGRGGVLAVVNKDIRHNGPTRGTMKARL